VNARNARLEPAWIDKTEHVRFVHHCTDGPTEVTLSNIHFNIITIEPLCVLPPVHCERCGWRGVVLLGEVLVLRIAD
jgi:hypothetical protein